MASLRDAILAGTKTAVQLHDEYGLRADVEHTGGGVDVFGTLLRLRTPLIFRPLDGILGACLPGPPVGVLISTQRPLRVQRFTGAHELGHVAMGHEASLDGEEILSRVPDRDTYDPREVAADAFAAAFLMPRWLLQIHARRQRWNRESMREPGVVYQLSLRIGASYDATCRALEREKIIDRSTRDQLLKVPPKRIKQELLPEHELANWHADVWLLTERDQGLAIEGQADDIFVLKLTEKGGAGYLWNLDGLSKAGFLVLNDRREIPTPDAAIGAPVTRALTAQHPDPSSGHFSIELRRPWQPTAPPLSSLHVAYDLFGKEVGLPRAARRQYTAA